MLSMTNTKIAGSTIATALIMALALAGCGEQVDSSNINTAGMYGDFSASADANGNTTVQMRLRVGGPTSNTWATLSEGDELEVTHDGTDAEVSSKNDLFTDRVYYEATVPTNDAGVEIEVGLIRQDFDDAPESTTVLPQPFSLDGPQSGAEYSRADDDIVVELDNVSDGNIEISVTGTCIRQYSEELGEVDEATITSGSLVWDDDDDEETCGATVEVRRVLTGAVDPAFEEGGQFDAAQVRSVDITSAP